MVGMRQGSAIRALLLGSMSLVFAFGPGGDARAFSSGPERTAADWHTGLAIYGFDPVAYFTQKAPRLGGAEYELVEGEVTWRFQNPGNRAAFMHDPDVYAPRFGGHDPVSVQRGVAVAGHPDFWIIHAGRLYLFAGPQTRAAFAKNPADAIRTAEQRWPNVVASALP